MYLSIHFLLESRSSSTYQDKANYTSDKSIDGLLSTFITAKEHFPWLEIELEAERLISGIVVVNIMDSGNRLRDLEVRVGDASVPLGYHGAQLTTNEVAGHFVGPGEDGETYLIQFTYPVRGKYISLQLLVEEYLQMEEVYLAGGWSSASFLTWY